MAPLTRSQETGIILGSLIGTGLLVGCISLTIFLRQRRIATRFKHKHSLCSLLAPLLCFLLTTIGFRPISRQQPVSREHHMIEIPPSSRQPMPVPSLTAGEQPIVPGTVNYILNTHGSLRSTSTPQRSSGAPSTLFGGPTLCNHGSQRSTSSPQRSSRAPSTLVESPLPGSYLSTSLHSAHVPSPLMSELPFSYQSSAALDSSPTRFQTLKLATERVDSSQIPKHVTTDQILQVDKQSQLEEIRSQGWLL